MCKDEIDSNRIEASVWRYAPESGMPGRMQTFLVTVDTPISVMMLLSMIHELDPSFACRTSLCFHGTCGSCYVNVDGRNTKGCMAMVAPGERVVIKPHSGYRVLRDVVVDFSARVEQEEKANES
jgi:succinate dehydrogenase / fumarate reductase, iron-sulfur subunit